MDTIISGLIMMNELFISFAVLDDWDDGRHWKTSKPIHISEFYFRRPEIEFIDGGICRFKDLGDDVKILERQYTGVRDTNDKPIFKGDIVRLDGDWVAEVVFEYGCFGLSYIPTVEHPWYISHYTEDIDSSCEIIGSIYENPDLLR